jgi:hypothetical protein
MQVNLVERSLSTGRVSGRASTVLVDRTTTGTVAVIVRVDFTKRSFSQERARGRSRVGCVQAIMGR